MQSNHDNSLHDNSTRNVVTTNESFDNRSINTLKKAITIDNRQHHNNSKHHHHHQHSHDKHKYKASNPNIKHRSQSNYGHEDGLTITNSSTWDMRNKSYKQNKNLKQTPINSKPTTYHHK